MSVPFTHTALLAFIVYLIYYDKGEKLPRIKNINYKGENFYSLVVGFLYFIRETRRAQSFRWEPVRKKKQRG